MRKKYVSLLILPICILLILGMSACGGEGGQEAQNDAGTEQAAAADTDFLLGTWFAKTATYEGEQKDPDDVFGGTFYLYFAEDGDCQMCIDQKRAPVKWAYNGDGVTLTGDNTYEITFPDGSRTKMNVTINGVEVMLEKFEE